MPSCNKTDYLVTRVRSVLEAIHIKADSEAKAIEAARKTLKKDWKVLNDKRRKNYKADARSSK